MISAVDQSEGAKMNLKLGGHHWKLFPDLFFIKKLNIKFLTEFLPSPFSCSESISIPLTMGVTFSSTNSFLFQGSCFIH